MAKAEPGLRLAARILVVDRDDAMRAVLERILSTWGHRVSSAASGEEALEAVYRAKPDLMTLGITMPGIDGLETLRLVRASRPDLPVIMLSGHASTATVVEAMRLGAQDFLRKPFRPDELERVVSNALSR